MAGRAALPELVWVLKVVAFVARGQQVASRQAEPLGPALQLQARRAVQRAWAQPEAPQKLPQRPRALEVEAQQVPPEKPASQQQVLEPEVRAAQLEERQEHQQRSVRQAVAAQPLRPRPSPAFQLQRRIQRQTRLLLVPGWYAALSRRHPRGLNWSESFSPQHRNQAEGR